MYEHRFQEVEDLLAKHLAPGEEFDLRWEEGRPRVRAAGSTGASPIAGADARFHGFLLQINERVERAGSVVVLLGLTAVAVLCVGIAADWWPEVFGRPSPLDTWVFYVSAPLVSLWALGTISSRLERRVVRNHQDELEDAMQELGIDRASLISMLTDIDELKDLREALTEGDDVVRWRDLD